VLWGYDESQDAALEQVFNACLDNGINLFDTGDSYGTGKLEGQAEKLLGQFSRRRGLTGAERPNVICVGTKLAAYPWRLTPKSMVDAIRASARRLGREDGSLELGQMHWAPSSYGFGFQEDALLAGLCDAYDQGLIRGVGLSNFGPKSLRKVHRRLTARGVPISTLQVRANPNPCTHTRTRPQSKDGCCSGPLCCVSLGLWNTVGWRSQTQFSLLSYLDYQRGTKEVCDELGITLIAYSPLCLGLLSGKYRAAARGEGQATPSYPPGPRGLLARQLLRGAEDAGLLPTLAEIAARRGVPESQVPARGGDAFASLVYSIEL
jgi:pyridoxine 4-dehydrogenase